MQVLSDISAAFHVISVALHTPIHSGVGHLLSYLHSQPLPAGTLVRVPLEMTPAPLELHAAYASRNSVNAKIRELLQMMQERLAVEEAMPLSRSLR